MNLNLKPYAAMKDSGVEWLGVVPEHWEQVPGRSCFSEKKVPNAGMVETSILSLSYGRIVIKPEEKLTGLVPESFETYQVVDPGDIICRPTDLQNDHTSLRFGFSNNRGIITSAYMCLETREQLARRFGYSLLHAYDLKKVFYGLGSGLRQNLRWNDFKYLPCAIPPLPEQDAIVRFIDYADRRIRRHIRAKQKLIKLLEEQKQAIIHRAVTRGLDPDVPLKPSGVEWLGDVPEHWEVQRLGRISRIFNGSTPSRMKPAYWQGGTVPWLSSSKVNDRAVLIPSELVTERAVQECSISLVPKGAVIIGLVGQGKTRGKASILGIEACISQNIAAIVPPSGLSGIYLHLFLTAFYLTIREFGRGGNQEALNCEIVSNLRVSIPPLDEQRKTVEETEALIQRIAESITRANREIELLNEYRTRLIADVVTGKLDVRKAAASFPDEVGDPESTDDLDEMIETEMDLADDEDDQEHHDQEHDDE